MITNIDNLLQQKNLTLNAKFILKLLHQEKFEELDQFLDINKFDLNLFVRKDDSMAISLYGIVDNKASIDYLINKNVVYDPVYSDNTVSNNPLGNILVIPEVCKAIFNSPLIPLENKHNSIGSFKKTFKNLNGNEILKLVRDPEIFDILVKHGANLNYQHNIKEPSILQYYINILESLNRPAIMDNFQLTASAKANVEANAWNCIHMICKYDVNKENLTGNDMLLGYIKNKVPTKLYVDAERIFTAIQNGDNKKISEQLKYLEDNKNTLPPQNLEEKLLNNGFTKQTNKGTWEIEGIINGHSPFDSILHFVKESKIDIDGVLQKERSKNPLSFEMFISALMKVAPKKECLEFVDNLKLNDSNEDYIKHQIFKMIQMLSAEGMESYREAMKQKLLNEATLQFEEKWIAENTALLNTESKKGFKLSQVLEKAESEFYTSFEKNDIKNQLTESYLYFFKNRDDKKPYELAVLDSLKFRIEDLEINMDLLKIREILRTEDPLIR